MPLRDLRNFNLKNLDFKNFNADDIGAAVADEALSVIPETKVIKYVKWGVIIVVIIISIILIIAGAAVLKATHEAKKGVPPIIVGIILLTLIGVWIGFTGFGIGYETVWNVKHSPAAYMYHKYTKKK